MFRPYDAASAVGDLSPTQAKPPKSNKCGAFGQILLAAIAVAVTAIATAGIGALASGAAFSSAFGAVTSGSLATLGATATAGGALTGGLGVAGAIGVAAAGGAIGSIVSQGIGVATGLQQSFSWKGVALAGLSAGITQGVGGSGLFRGISSPVLRTGVNGAVSNALTQGLGVATGLQDKFDWAGVAAAGIGAGVGRAVGGIPGFGDLGKLGGSLVSNMAGGIANAASRSVINGTDFGDNIMAALPDIIGQTIGGIIADGLAGRTTRAPAAGDSLQVPDSEISVLNTPPLDHIDVDYAGLADILGVDVPVDPFGQLSPSTAAQVALSGSTLADQSAATNGGYDLPGMQPEAGGTGSYAANLLYYALKSEAWTNDLRLWVSGDGSADFVAQQMASTFGGSRTGILEWANFLDAGAKQYGVSEATDLAARVRALAPTENSFSITSDDTLRNLYFNSPAPATPAGSMYEGSIIGKIWNSPNTALTGLPFAGAGYVTSYTRYIVGWQKNAPRMSFGHNALQLENNYLNFGGAITLGNVISYGNGANDPYGDNHQVGWKHEIQHTYQGEILGPLYLPAAGISLSLGELLDGDAHGPHSFMETGPGDKGHERMWP
jgi:hypothetical protein